uniref:Uncharacterized protein n=1 Tax=Arundo donax TaxID=35708 RepID=A0A0A9FI09_ARUDO
MDGYYIYLLTWADARFAIYIKQLSCCSSE